MARGRMIAVLVTWSFAGFAYSQANYDLPLFGGMPKTEAQLTADRWYIDGVTRQAGSREIAARAVLENAWEYLRRGDARLAIRRFNQVQLLTPDLPDVYWGFGAAVAHQGKNNEAIGFFEKAILLDPQSKERVLPFALALHRSGGYATAVSLFSFLASRGSAAAQRALGFMYEKGQGVARDDTKAMTLYRQAADQGDMYGEYNLGGMYERGQGIGKDATEAAKWYQKAANQGLALAQNSLAGLYSEGAGVPKDYGEALKWARRAAEQGHPTAQYNLGRMYERGEGVATDLTEARNWYRKAAGAGNADAKKSLQSLEHLSPD